MWGSLSFTQDQAYADSLLSVYQRIELNDSLELRLLKGICLTHNNPDVRIYYSTILLQKALEADNKTYQGEAYHSLGLALRRKGALTESLDALFQSARISNELKSYLNLAADYAEISTTYTSAGDLKNSLAYSNKAIQILRLIRTDEPRMFAHSLLNIGYDYYVAGMYDTALMYYNEAEPILDSLSIEYSLLYLIGNRALVKWKLGEIDSAIADLNYAILGLEDFGDEYAMADYHNQLGNIYLENDKQDKAITHLSRGVKMAARNDLKEQVRDASKLLSSLYDSNDQADSAYHYLNLYLAMRDSITDEEVIQQLANQRADFEIELKEQEVANLEEKRRTQRFILWMVVLLGLIALLGLYKYQRRRAAQKLEKQSIDKRIAELKALKAQINPHFLFNALNSIQSYILEDKYHIAETYLVKYGKLIRKILDHSNELIVPLHEELESLNLYISLEQIRVKGGFKFDVILDDSIDPYTCYVPSMAIQPFLENAIWHGISGLDGKGKIDLTFAVDNDHHIVTIEDNGVGFDTDQMKKSTSKGINLVNERLTLLQKTEGSSSAIKVDSVEGKGTTVVLSFPKDLG